ncbi:flagellar basal body-associated protein FliL [Bacillus testis]|uniref:flagellar basal body-associated protein FliL n=1 Tax=Bacillus testis TaxID=1622072 RepID=UPI00067EDB8F|nr:flagellar basal body-associated protein FliL [Bacillus testis]
MKKNKPLTIMIIILVVITLVAAIALVMVLNTKKDDSKGPSIDQIVKTSVEVPEITTNLDENGFIKISFMIETDSKSAKKELEKRNFQVKNIIIKELSQWKSSQMEGEQWMPNLESKLKDKFNGIMQDGKVEEVLVTSSIIQ